MATPTRRDSFLSAISTECGGLAFQRNQLVILVLNTPLSDACAAFGALHDASGSASVILG